MLFLHILDLKYNFLLCKFYVKIMLCLQSFKGVEMDELIKFEIKQTVKPKNISFQGKIIKIQKKDNCLQYIFKLLEDNEDNEEFVMPNSSDEVKENMIVNIIIAGKKKESHSWEINDIDIDNNTYQLILYPSNGLKHIINNKTKF